MPANGHSNLTGPVQEADSSMEASEGLNPVSSQGYAEIQRCEAIALAQAGLIRSKHYR
jgi:hypothetical protein